MAICNIHCSGPDDARYTADVMNDQIQLHPVSTSSMASSAVTSLGGATDRQCSVAGTSAASSVPLTEETIVSWTGSEQLHKVLHYNTNSGTSKPGEGGCVCVGSERKC